MLLSDTTCALQVECKLGGVRGWNMVRMKIKKSTNIVFYFWNLIEKYISTLLSSSVQGSNSNWTWWTNEAFVGNSEVSEVQFCTREHPQFEVATCRTCTLRSKKAILEVATSYLQKWRGFPQRWGPCMPIWHPLMHIVIVLRKFKIYQV